MSVTAEAIGVTEGASQLAIETVDLTKFYGSLAALSGLTISVPAGSVFALIGPNGAGKTTTFQILATLLQPTSGYARVFGTDPVDDPFEVRKVLGYMPDFFGVYDDVRVDEYLDFFASAYRVPPGRRGGMIKDLLELVDLSGKRDAFVDSLSRGMKQRLGLARALIHDPQLLILDEPASGLDPRARIELRELIRELQVMGKTIFISSHILMELEEVATEVGILEAGKLLAQGDPSSMLSSLEGARVLRVRLVDPSQLTQATDLVAPLNGIVTVDGSEDSIEVVFSGHSAEQADLLSVLIRSGVGVLEFTEDRANLEDVFMKITEGRVQ